MKRNFILIFILFIMGTVKTLANECAIDYSKIDKSKVIAKDFYILTDSVTSIKYVDPKGNSKLIRCSEVHHKEHILACQALYYNENYTPESMWRDGIIPVNGMFIFTCETPVYVFESYK